VPADLLTCLVSLPACLPPSSVHVVSKVVEVAASTLDTQPHFDPDALDAAAGGGRVARQAPLAGSLPSEATLSRQYDNVAALVDRRAGEHGAGPLAVLPPSWLALLPFLVLHACACPGCLTWLCQLILRPPTRPLPIQEASLAALTTLLPGCCLAAACRLSQGTAGQQGGDGAGAVAALPHSRLQASQGGTEAAGDAAAS
jgi:hypothetical protein